MTHVDGLDLIIGEASFVDSKTVAVNGEAGLRTLSADTIIISTGARPFVPKIDGLDTIDFLDSTSIMELGEVPEHLVVVGGGYIGLEFGQMFSRFGAKVSIIQKGSQLLPRVDADFAEMVTGILREDGIKVLLNTSPVKFEKTAGGTKVQLQTEDGPSDLLASHVLIATGRVPSTDMLNATNAGIQFDKRGFVETDEFMRTGVDGVYAMGDVKGGPAFTHIAYDDYRILAHNLLTDNPQKSIVGRDVPWTAFIDPQLAHVGFSEKEARQQGLDVSVLTMPMTRVAMANERAESRGMMKAIVENGSGKILGFTALAYEGGELVSMVQLAMNGGLTAQDLYETTFTHPSLAESLNNLFAKFEG